MAVLSNSDGQKNKFVLHLWYRLADDSARLGIGLSDCLLRPLAYRTEEEDVEDVWVDNRCPVYSGPIAFGAGGPDIAPQDLFCRFFSGHQ